MTDPSTTVDDLKRLVARFVDERNWRQFHTPKNLSMSIAVEAAELMEHFQWLTAEESLAVAGDAGKRDAAGEELADVVCYALAMANALELDLAGTIERKMAKNAQKYPAEEFRGRFGHDDPRPADG
jgi:NTP pyrophosphatase (non-canonical NTP hydrolase)